MWIEDDRVIDAPAGREPDRVVDASGCVVMAGAIDVHSHIAGGNVILSSAARNASGTPSNKKLLEVGQATLTSTGVIDLNDNDMLIHDTTVLDYSGLGVEGLGQVGDVLAPARRGLGGIAMLQREADGAMSARRAQGVASRTLPGT